MGRVLVTIATMLILVLGAAFVVPSLIDWEAYRSPLEDAASAALGRRIATKGKIDIVLLPEPAVRLGQVTLSGSGANPHATLVTADAVDVALSLQALIGGRIEANTVKLLRPTLQLDLSHDRSATLHGVEDGAFPLTADVHNLEIEDGSLTVFAKEIASGKPATFEKINGTLSSPSPGGPYRFGGRFVRNGRVFDIKFLTSSSGDQRVKLTGSIVDPISKASVQAEGALSLRDGPVFEGSLGGAATANGAGSSSGLRVQAKSTAKVNLSGLALTDLAITIDPENRAQTLAGSGNVAFASNIASFTLQAHSIDADALLAGGANLDTAGAADWEAFIGAADRLLWFYPDAGLRLSLNVDQVQLRGEPIESVKLDGQRNGNRWVFEKLLGLFPGDTALKAVGTLSKSGGSPQLSGVVSADGKNIARLARWLAPAGVDTKSLSPRPFTLKGSMTLTDEVAALEGVTGSVGETPFNASLHLDKSPDRKLYLSLSGDSFDLSDLDLGQWDTNGLSLNALLAQKNTFPWAGPLSDASNKLSAAEIDISVGDIKTSALEARNLVARASFTPDMLTVRKLSIETPEGLAISGQGVVPFKGTSQGAFDGRLEAQSPQALGQFVKFAGYDSLAGRRFEDFAPASLSFSYAAGAPGSDNTTKIAGNLGGTRIDGKGQLKGTLADWRNGAISAELNAATSDGNKLLQQLFPNLKSAPLAAQAPGNITLRLSGPTTKLGASASVKAALLQMQIDGTTEIKDGSYSFTGKVAASSLTPNLFLPAPVLALIGGDSPDNLRVEADLAIQPNFVEADKLKAETLRNVVTGNLSLDTSGNVARLDADLRTDQLSLPNLLNYFTVSSSGGGQPTLPAIDSPSADPSEIWSNRPFAVSAFKNASARISVAAKTLKISDALVISNAQTDARLEDGRFELRKLEGETLGGKLSANLVLETGANSVAARTKIALTDIDLSAFPGGDKPPLISGKAAMVLSASGEGLSPRGLVSVMGGRGHISISDGQIYKLSPTALYKAADEMLTNPLPLPEDVVTKRSSEALKSGDFRFRRLAIPVVIDDGVLEIRRASFRNRDQTIRLATYLDLSKMQVDSTWQIGVRSDRHAKWPPVKLTSAGALRDLGGHPQSLSAEDFARAIIVRKMEGDINRLEGLNRPAPSPSLWTTKQEAVGKSNPKQKRNAGPPYQGAATQNNAPPSKTPVALPPSDFEKRMRDALQAQDAANADPQTRRAP